MKELQLPEHAHDRAAERASFKEEPVIDEEERTITGEPARFRLLLISLLAAALGVATGFIAYLLYGFIALCTNLVFYHHVSFVLTSPMHHHLGAWVILMPILGALVIGVMAKYGSSKIRGHGIPEAMEAVLVRQSRIAPSVAVLKPLSAGIAIGTGGPFGAEGPIIQTGGAVGSLLGQLLHTTASERKVLLACGAAAGMAATFGSPIAAVILAFELLLFEFKPRSFIPLVISSTLATNVHYYLMGRQAMFEVGAMDFRLPWALPFYAVLGILCGFTAVAFTKALYWFEDQFEKLTIDPMWWPAMGAVVLGVVGYFFPRVFGVGYETITDTLAGKLSVSVLLGVVVLKTLVLLVSIGSGTSGGLLAPSFMFSAALGALFAMVANAIFPSAHLSPGAFALVSMGAVFGAASRATLAFIIFAFEITRNYDAVLPLMLVGVLASGIALHYMRNSIMTEKLARRGIRIHQEYEPDVLHHATVADVMDGNVETVDARMLAEDLAAQMVMSDPLHVKHRGVPIVDEAGMLAGIVTRGDVMRAIEAGNGSDTVLEIGERRVITAFADESLHEATVRMLRHHVGRLPVVSRENPRKVVGYLGRRAVLTARMRRIHEEHVVEAGWIGRGAGR